MKFRPYFLKDEVSPHLAAEIENIEINFEKIKKYWENLKIKYKTIIIEGAGGVYVPLVRNKYFIFNLIKDLNIPVILVCSTKVGAVNHTLLTINFLKNTGIKIHGIVFNRVSENIKNFEKDNIEIILKTGEIKKYLIIKENQKNISEDEILKFFFNRVSENIKNFEKDNIEIILKTGEIKKYLIIKENQKNISEDEILKFLEEDNE